MKRACILAVFVLLFGNILLGQKETAPELRKSNVWINSAPLTLKSLKGKVVVIDFWAFDCAPCIETMPHIVDLYSRYAGQGLVIIGVHSPRTDDEKDAKKLRDAVQRMGVAFPVVGDNSHNIWSDYRCDIWPTLFVIDRSGTIQFVHGGVGRYDDVEKTVQRLLATK